MKHNLTTLTDIITVSFFLVTSIWFITKSLFYFCIGDENLYKNSIYTQQTFESLLRFSCSCKMTFEVDSLNFLETRDGLILERK